MIVFYVGSMLFFVILMALYSLEIKRFFMHLKEYHADEYHKLGAPRWNFQLGDPTLRLAMRYIKKKEYKHLNDSMLDTIHKSMKLYILLSIISAVMTLVGAFFA